MSSGQMPSPITNAALAQQALINPATPAGVLAQIAQDFPALRFGVASHPNAYPGLLDWLAQCGDPAVSLAVAQRRMATPVTAVTTPVAYPVDATVATQMMGSWRQPTAEVPPIWTPLAVAPPEQGISGGVIALIIGVGAVILGLIAWLVIVPALRSGGASSSPTIPQTSHADGAQSGGASTGQPGSTQTEGFHSGDAAYDAVINGGAVASEATIDANAWARAIKAAGVLKVGGTMTSGLFSMLDPRTGVVTGFDAGLSQLLARYIIGDAKTEVTQVTVDTRESLVTTHQVDMAIATYSITQARMQKVNFAGPYYQSQAAILVRADNSTIRSVNDLAGKRVATQANSTGVTILQQYAPQAIIVSLPDHNACVAAVQQGQADAYVIDQTLLLNALMSNNDFKIVGDPFGPTDYYGIGVAKDSDARAFIDAWLQTIEADGTWLKLWQATIGARTGAAYTPTAPAINSAGNG